MVDLSMAATTSRFGLLLGCQQHLQRNRLQPKVLHCLKYSARRDASAKTGPQGDSSDDDSPVDMLQEPCGNNDPNRGPEEVWTLQQLDKWCGFL